MPTRYVAIGDSLSEGVGDTPWPAGTARGFADRLAALLAAHHGSLEYANLAVRGYTAGRVCEHQVEAAVALAPDIVSVTAGMNDILRPRLDVEALRSTLSDLVTPFTTARATVLLVPIPDVTGISPAGRLGNSRRVRLNGILHQLSEELGALLVSSAGTVFDDPRAWASDRLHLSALGHEHLALAAAASLGIAADPGPVPRLTGTASERTLRTDAEWWWRYAKPWIARRVRSQSSGDGRTAKRPTLRPVDSPDSTASSGPGGDRPGQVV